MRCAQLVGLGTLLALLHSCGGGDNSLTPGGGPPPFTAVPQVRVSQPTSLVAGCDGVPVSGTLFNGTAIEPSLAQNPATPSNLIATWQQNRWSNGGSQLIGVAASFDGGNSWSLSSPPVFSRCAGGNSGNAGNYARASNAWVSISPNGVAYALALAFTGQTFAAGSSSAMLVAQSLNGGANWSLPLALIQDGAAFFNDKGSITADPTNSNYVYAVWDRLAGQTAGPTYFSSTANANSTWSTAQSIYDPGANNQTIGNVIVVTPDDTLVNLFNEIDTAADGTASSHLKAIVSVNHGSTWSTTPVSVADILAVGTTDPNGGKVRDSALLFTAAVGPKGAIYVAWQDARFSSGAHDGIALSYSTDDGATWTKPVQVNADASVQAFTPTLNVSAAGVIAVTYYDLRNAMDSTTELLTDCWIVTSTDAVTFTESHLSGPFDLQLAPDTDEGFFLGDYEALTNDGAQFEPFYAQTNQGMGVSSDVFFSFPPNAPATAHFQARPAPRGAGLTRAARARMSERIRLAQAQRLNRG
ncbi:MAG TPA: sialidase family protein [Steroidobacteraceae bacterium]|nr:sialidase family protein [Steroidobacteraceae bacterium]